MSDRCIDIKGLAGDPLLLLRRQVLQCTHIVQTVDQFDQNDTDVLCHGDQDLAVVDRLILFLVGKFQIGDLGDRFNHLVDLLTKFFDEFFFGDVAVFDDVMQKTGRDRIWIGLEFCQLIGHVETMHKIRLAGAPLLILVLFVGIVVCLVYESNRFLVFDVGIDLLIEVFFCSGLVFHMIINLKTEASLRSSLILHQSEDIVFV